MISEVRNTINYHDLYKSRTRIAKQKDLSLFKIPPCEASFLQNVKRAAWQARVWKGSHVGFPDLGPPLDFGWIQKQGCDLQYTLKGVVCLS